MEIELIEIRDFLAQRPPFDELPAETLDQLPRQLELRYLRRGSAFPPADTEEPFVYILRSGAVELRDRKGELLEKLAEGDVYVTPCQLGELSEQTPGVTSEDTLLYLLPCAGLRRLRRTSKAFDRHFSDSLRERLRHALDQPAQSLANNLGYMTAEVGTLVTREPVTIGAERSIREAAQVMSAHDVSSVLLTERGRLVGVITDRDLRKRCVAEGLRGSLPARTIVSGRPDTIQSTALALEALLAMMRLRLHHLPVMDGDRLVGVLTATDLARHQSASPAFIAAEIHKAQTVDDLARASARLPALQRNLAESSATALHIGEAIACITDALTTRLITMAEQRLGPPPVPYAWLAGGSQARREQTSHSDQDNALIVADTMKPADNAYFAALAKFVNDGLHACGFVYCPGNAMASNPQWCQPLLVWRRYFSEWIDKPEPMALMLSSIFFDLRTVHGDKELLERLQREVLRKTRNNRIFIAYMASNALTHRPPLGFFRTFVLIHDGEHDDTFDIKHRGIVPITDLARVYALSEGLAPVNTTERLRAAAETRVLSREMGENLEDALELIAGLRINHQADQIRRGQPADNYLPPSALSELERKHLKDAFKVIQTVQETLASRYQTGRLR
jgi:CBS domain-containing protein